MDAFRGYRAIWDQEGRMNPGKLIDARPLDEDLRHGLSYLISPLATTRPGGFALGRDRLTPWPSDAWAWAAAGATTRT